jgi:hypothetical protein
MGTAEEEDATGKAGDAFGFFLVVTTILFCFIFFILFSIW